MRSRKSAHNAYVDVDYIPTLGLVSGKYTADRSCFKSVYQLFVRPNEIRKYLVEVYICTCIYVLCSIIVYSQQL